MKALNAKVTLKKTINNKYTQNLSIVIKNNSLNSIKKKTMAVCDHHKKLGYLSMLYIRVTPPCCDNCTLVKIQTKMSNKNMKMNE